MTARRIGLASLAAAVLTVASGVALAQQAADNTRNNQSYSNGDGTTADSQKQDTADIRLTQQIRKSVLADHDLSTYAHNVKIVAMHGNVTLSGVVRSEDEKRTIESKATEVAGSGHVVNDLKVQPPR